MERNKTLFRKLPLPTAVDEFVVLVKQTEADWDRSSLSMERRY
jgi:hypothetical protein